VNKKRFFIFNYNHYNFTPRPAQIKFYIKLAKQHTYDFCQEDEKHKQTVTDCSSFRQCWKEVNDLETKKEEIMKKAPVEIKKDADSDDELNEEMLNEFLDWRSKKVAR